MPPTAQSRPPTFSAAIQAAARRLLVAPNPEDRELGRALLGCEPLSLRKSKEERLAGRQDLIGHVGAGNDEDRQLLDAHEEQVAKELSLALGVWPGAMSLKIDPLDPTQWVHASKPVTPLADQRLDRFLNDAIATNPTGDGKEALIEHQAWARVILRRLRYRASYDWGKQGETPPSLHVWTTPIGVIWCDLFNQFTPSAIQNLPRRLLEAHPTLAPLTVDECTMDPNDWGDVDPERNPIRVLELTTSTGSTAADVHAIFKRAGQQIALTTRYTDTSDSDHPLSVFNTALEGLAGDDVLNQTDVLLVHRGGGVTTDGDKANVTLAEKEAMQAAFTAILSRGVEVVLAIGHADTRIFAADEHKRIVGFFEATTPTAGAAWILKEHINSRLVNDEDVYSQPMPESD